MKICVAFNKEIQEKKSNVHLIFSNFHAPHVVNFSKIYLKAFELKSFTMHLKYIFFSKT